MLRQIFFSPGEPRLRAGWRLLLQTVLMLALFIGAGTLLFPLLTASEQTLNTLLVIELGQGLAMAGSVLLARKYLDRRSVESLGLRRDRLAWLDMVAGIAISFLQMAGIYLAMRWLGWSSFESLAWQIDPAGTVILTTLAAILFFVMVGVSEELLSRGYHLQTIASGTTPFWGLVLSSAIFGLLHLFNPSASWVSTTGIFLAGLYLGFAYLRTNQLWLPIGLHIGWNFFEGVGFGFPVSGHEIYRLLRHEVQGPELWTGGAFGPEAGLIVVPALAVGALLVHLYVRTIRKSTE